ncbi:MAG: GTP 3',8-cyclase MoaA [Candidatus Latescibacteria bacterium]|nr:GTP 3',8-cyclase MoaA [Candidatus Latescibacterota bacterium]
MTFWKKRTSLLDPFGRTVDYLRVSVIDHCNLQCIYCVPPGSIPWTPKAELLTDAEIARVVRAAADLGICKVRITGGEPLVRPGLPDLIQTLSSISGIEEVSLTTNGTLLARCAQDLAAAGLKRLNISLDTLWPHRFRQITGFDGLDQVWAGITAAVSAGLSPIKLNVVVMRGINDDEVGDFATLTRGHPYQVRFIEFMPIGPTAHRWRDLFVPAEEILSRLEGAEPLTQECPEGVAHRFRLPGAAGTIGVISPMSRPFCGACTRLRLSADGYLRPCLFSGKGVDLKDPLRAGIPLRKLRLLIQSAAAAKPEGWMAKGGAIPEAVAQTMCEIGG